jgi:hypothetical protein
MISCRLKRPLVETLLIYRIYSVDMGAAWEVLRRRDGPHTAHVRRFLFIDAEKGFRRALRE